MGGKVIPIQPADENLEATNKDQPHILAVVVQGLAVFLAGIGISVFNPPVAIAVWLSGGVVVLANVWFAWTVRATNAPSRILIFHLIRFFLYIVGMIGVIKLLQQDPLTSVFGMIGAHVVYVLANMCLSNFRGARSTES